MCYKQIAEGLTSRLSEILTVFGNSRTVGNTESLIMTGQEETLSTKSVETGVYNIKKT